MLKVFGHKPSQNETPSPIPASDKKRKALPTEQCRKIHRLRRTNLRTLVIALALSTACTAYAQTGCSSSSTSSSLPETSGCLPATFTPADGGPSRPVLLDVQFTNFQGGSAPTAPSAVKLRELAIGVFGSYDSPDYNSNGNIGVGAWATFTANHFGVQADAVDDIDSRGGVEERSIVVGPRYQVRRHGITLYAKAQAGASPERRLANPTTSPPR
jgi:hypothetical protein